MNSLILLAALSYQVGDCWRDKLYSGLSNTYGNPMKIVEIGTNSVVYQTWVKSIDEWSSNFRIQDKESFQKELDKSHEKITCPKSSVRS